ncbi:MAG TPA: non-homologous end-joining DNA ligase [Thermoanaerobaculia bacterium]|jgi:DNA ligase D-like protein (predicted ligase)|nr:non-homologous end-joining DNA ligase [Thermoanaerobaculia bacterium]
MLATLVQEPFHYPGWVYEEKYDGYRILAYKEGDRVKLLSRNAKDRTGTFSDVARALERLRERTLLLDGEVAAFDRNLVSRFQLLQRGDVPYVYAVFDCLYRNGRDLRNEQLSVRRDLLEEAIGDTDHLVAARRLHSNGFKAYEQAKRRGYEGVVGKDASAPYIEGRSRKWLKVKVHQEEEFVIGGYTPPAGSRPYLGALLLGAYSGSDLRYVGKVGTGFTQKTLATLYKKFQPLVRKTPPFVDPPRERGAVWLAPKLVAQIRFQEWTHDWKLRQPVFLGLRDDKSPDEVIFPEPT